MASVAGINDEHLMDPIGASILIQEWTVPPPYIYCGVDYRPHHSRWDGGAAQVNCRFSIICDARCARNV